MGCRLCALSPPKIKKVEEVDKNIERDRDDVEPLPITSTTTSKTPTMLSTLEICVRQGFCSIPTNYKTLDDAIQMLRKNKGIIREIRMESCLHKTTSLYISKKHKDKDHLNEPDREETLQIDLSNITIKGENNAQLSNGLIITAKNVTLESLTFVQKGLLVKATGSLNVINCNIYNCISDGVFTRGGNISMINCHIHHNV